MDQTLYPWGGGYQLVIICVPSERVWSTVYTLFVLKKLTDFVNC